MRVIVAGTRHYTDKLRIFKCINTISEYFDGDIEIVSGLARGPDTIGKDWAKSNNKKCYEFPANWDKFGKRAGFLRNEKMAEFSDVLLAFWDGKSSGTSHMINLARQYGLKVVVIKI